MWGKMMQGKTAFLLAGLLVFSVFVMGQVDPVHINNENIFTTDYQDYEALDINPANLAAHKQPEQKISFGLLQIDAIMYNPVIKNRLFHEKKVERVGDAGIVNNLKDGGLWIDEILVDRTSVNLDITLLGMSIHSKKAGSFAFNIKTNINADAEVNGVFEDLEYEDHGFTNLAEVISQTLQDNLETGNYLPGTGSEKSYVRASAISEVNLGYSRKIINNRKLKLFGGASMKYVMGIADIGLQFNENELIGYYSFGDILPAEWEQYNAVSNGQSTKRFGHGFGTSIGVALKLEAFRAGISILDMGFIKWPAHSIYLTQLDAIGSIIGQEDVENAIGEVVSDFQRKREGVELLPTRMVIGASYDVHRYVSFYLDFVTPFQESARNLSNPTIGLGTSLSLKGYLTLKMGPTLQNKRLVTFPMYLSIFGGKNKRFEISAGTADLISFFKPDRYYAQASMGLMKFHF